MPQSGSIDYALKLESGKIRMPSNYKSIQHSEIPMAGYKFPTSRFTLVEFYPETGRMHQIRKHAAHIFHPIVADRPHGCNKLNRILIEKLNIHHMPLHAYQLEIKSPRSGKALTLKAPLPGRIFTDRKIIGF